MKTISLGEYHAFMMQHVLKPFQKDAVLSVLQSTKLGLLGSRQIGKTYFLAYVSILLGIGTNDIPGHDVLIISETEAKAKKIIADIHKHLDMIETACFPIRQANRGGLFEVVFLNGSTITAKPGKPTALQAYTGTVIVDELSLTQFDPEELFGQALIVASSKPYYRTIICSNADHEGSFINNLWLGQDSYWKDKRHNWNLMDVNIYDVFPEELPDQIKEVKASLSPVLWNKFYENKFVSGNSPYFNYGKVKDAVGRGPIGEGDIVIGWDPGFTRHGSGIVVCRVGNGLEVLCEQLLFNMPTDVQVELLDELVKQYKATKIVIDHGLGGLVLKQQLESRYGTRMVNGVSVNKNNYNSWGKQLEVLMHEGRLSIHSSCLELTEDLMTIEVNKQGGLSVPERQTKQGVTHCDTGVALLMCCSLLGQARGPGRDMEVVDVAPFFTDNKFL